jgi:hypothetical protein
VVSRLPLKKNVKVNFSKIVALKGTIKFLVNMVAVHFEGPMHPRLFATPFLCYCSFK